MQTHYQFNATTVVVWTEQDGMMWTYDRDRRCLLRERHDSSSLFGGDDWWEVEYDPDTGLRTKVTWGGTAPEWLAAELGHPLPSGAECCYDCRLAQVVDDLGFPL